MVDTEKGGEGQQQREEIHQIGETVTLGEGYDVIQHTITGVRVAHRVGGKFAQEIPNHLFVIVAVEIQNKSAESFRISKNVYMIRDAEGRTYEPDSWADIF